MRKRVVLLDIAKELNVSKNTVSRALRDCDDISQEMKMKIISEKICQEAQNNGKNPNYYSPFEQDAHNYGLHFRGGKLDDTTIISSIVVNDNEK